MPVLDLIQNRREMSFLLHPAGHSVWLESRLFRLPWLSSRSGWRGGTTGAARGSDPVTAQLRVQDRVQCQVVWLNADRLASHGSTLDLATANVCLKQFLSAPFREL